MKQLKKIKRQYLRYTIEQNIRENLWQQIECFILAKIHSKNESIQNIKLIYFECIVITINYKAELVNEPRKQHSAEPTTTTHKTYTFNNWTNKAFMFVNLIYLLLLFCFPVAFNKWSFLNKNHNNRIENFFFNFLFFLFILVGIKLIQRNGITPQTKNPSWNFQLKI